MNEPTKDDSWICSACETTNDGKARTCESCGESVEPTESDPVQAKDHGISIATRGLFYSQIGILGLAGMLVSPIGVLSVLSPIGLVLCLVAVAKTWPTKPREAVVGSILGTIGCIWIPFAILHNVMVAPALLMVLFGLLVWLLFSSQLALVHRMCLGLLPLFIVVFGTVWYTTGWSIGDALREYKLSRIQASGSDRVSELVAMLKSEASKPRDEFRYFDREGNEEQRILRILGEIGHESDEAAEGIMWYLSHKMDQPEYMPLYGDETNPAIEALKALALRNEAALNTLIGLLTWDDYGTPLSAKDKARGMSKMYVYYEPAVTALADLSARDDRVFQLLRDVAVNPDSHFTGMDSIASKLAKHAPSRIPQLLKDENGQIRRQAFLEAQRRRITIPPDATEQLVMDGLLRRRGGGSGTPDPVAELEKKLGAEVQGRTITFRNRTVSSDAIDLLKRMNGLILSLDHATVEDWTAVGELSLESLWLNNLAAAPGSLKHLSGTGVKNFGVSHCQIRPGELEGLQLSQLRSLHVTNTRLHRGALSRLASPETLRTLNLQYSHADELAGLGELKNLTSLKIDNTGIGDDALTQIASLVNLATLSLNQTSVSDDGMQHLTGLKKLRVLSLGNTSITDTGLAAITGLSELVVVGLNGTKVTGEGVRQLARLSKLNRLRLDSTPVGDQGLSHIARLSKLTDLRLDNTEITDHGLSSVAALSSLSSLNIGKTKVTDSGMVHLTKLTKLRNLHLSNAEISNEGLAEIARLQTIQTLALGDVNVDDNGVGQLKSLTKLTTLDLRGTRVTNKGLEFLRSCKNLRSVNLNGTSAADGLAWDSLKNLTRVSLTDTGVGDETFESLAKLPRLSSLSIGGTRITNVALSHLSSRSLRILDLRNTSIDDTGLQHLNGVPSLVSLNLSGTKVTNAGLALLKQHTSLQTLNLSDTSITDDGLGGLNAFEELGNLYLGNTAVTDDGLELLQKILFHGMLAVNGTRVTDGGLKYLNPIRLHGLDLTDTQVTDEGLGLLESFFNLRTLRISGTGVSVEAVDQFREAMPNCRVEFESADM